MTGVSAIDYVDGMQIIEMPVVIEGDLDNAEVRCEIIIGGVTYLDGTTTESLYLTDFDAFGIRELLFKKPFSVHSNCHRISIWHNGTRVAYYN